MALPRISDEGIFCGSCGEYVDTSGTLGLSVDYGRGERTRIQNLGPVIHECAVPRPVSSWGERVHRWTVSESNTPGADVPVMDIGVAPRPRTAWQRFWFHMAMGSLMHYPIHKVFVWSIRNRDCPS